MLLLKLATFGCRCNLRNEQLYEQHTQKAISIYNFFIVNIYNNTLTLAAHLHSHLRLAIDVVVVLRPERIARATKAIDHNYFVDDEQPPN